MKNLRTLLIASTFLSLSQFSFAADIEESVSSQAVSSYMQQFNVSYEEATRRLKIMDESQTLAADIVKELGENSIAGVFFDNGKDFKILVRTTKKGGKQYKLVNKFVQDNLKDLPIEVIPGSSRNFRAIENIIKNQSNVLAKKLPGFQSLAYNPKTDSLVLEISEEDKSKKEAIIREYNLEKISGMETVVNLIDGEISPVKFAGGGALLDTKNARKCTGGWPAKNLAGEPGLITAYHCISNGNTMDFNYNGNDGSSYRLKAIIPKASDHDLIFLKAPAGTAVDEPTFYKDFTPTSYYVYSGIPKTSLKVSETQLCHFGRTTGYSCGIVSNIDARIYKVSSDVKDANGKGVEACNGSNYWCGPSIIITGPSLKCNSGDSGGPVFYGTNRPQGVASACNLKEISTGQPAKLYFTPLEYASEISTTVQKVPWG